MNDKFSPFGLWEVLTTNLEGTHEYNEAAFQGADLAVVVELHAEAIALGWVIESVSLESGWNGVTSGLFLARKGFGGNRLPVTS